MYTSLYINPCFLRPASLGPYHPNTNGQYTQYPQNTYKNEIYERNDTKYEYKEISHTKNVKEKEAKRSAFAVVRHSPPLQQHWQLTVQC